MRNSYLVEISSAKKSVGIILRIFLEFMILWLPKATLPGPSVDILDRLLGANSSYYVENLFISRDKVNRLLYCPIFITPGNSEMPSKTV